MVKPSSFKKPGKEAKKKKIKFKFSLSVLKPKRNHKIYLSHKNPKITFKYWHCSLNLSSTCNECLFK